jgi:hypothetical protein
MNLLQMVQALQEESGSGNQRITSIANATGETLRLVNWIIRADLVIQSKFWDWKFLWRESTQPLTTGAGTATYAGPADLKVWNRKGFYLDDQWIADVQDFDSLNFPRGLSAGQPSAIYIMPNNQIRFSPTPDDAYDLTYEYYRTPYEMPIANASEPLIPAHFRYAIVFLALSYYATFENAPDAMSKAQQGIAEWMPKLEADQLPNHLGGTQSNGYDFAIRAE